MRKYLIGAIGGLLGALALREAYAKGYNKAVEDLKDKLYFIAAVNKKAEES